MSAEAKSTTFPGSRRLFEVADSITEIKTICRCGKKAVFNTRMVDGKVVFDGDQADPRNFNEAQYATRVQGLVEAMEANKKD